MTATNMCSNFGGFRCSTPLNLLWNNYRHRFILRQLMPSTCYNEEMTKWSDEMILESESTERS